jgi:hypothetical protein
VAITSVVLDMVAQAAHNLPAPLRMVCLGYPDMLLTEAQLEAACGAGTCAGLRWREDSASIVRWHRLEGQLARVAETRAVFERLGIESDFIDIVASRGVEIVLDLNQPLPREMHARYDIVYDGGTLEHCFNVGQVMANIAALARVGGFIVHANPINYYNHGFFNFNPTFYHDWYTQSGHAIVSPFYAMHGPVLARALTVLDPVAPFQPPERSSLLVAAMKRVDAPPRWPMQSKYLLAPQLKA